MHSGPPVYRGAQTARDVFSGKLQEHHIDDRARQVLKLVKRAMDSGIPFGAQESLIDNDQTRALLRKAAANAVVLLKNDKQVLPIKQAQKIAVIKLEDQLGAVQNKIKAIDTTIALGGCVA